MAMNGSSYPKISSDELALTNKLWNDRDESKVAFASVIVGEDKPLNFLRVLFDCAIAGGTAGVIVEAALYPIDTIKTRLQAARGGGKINLKGLYSGLVGNLAGVLPASAIFLGVYEPVKQKLLKTFPENLSKALIFLLAIIVRAANRPVEYDIDDELIAPRQQIWQPLINRPPPPATGVPVAGTLDQCPSRNDAWSSRIKEKARCFCMIFVIEK